MGIARSRASRLRGGDALFRVLGDTGRGPFAFCDAVSCPANASAERPSKGRGCNRFDKLAPSQCRFLCSGRSIVAGRNFSLCARRNRYFVNQRLTENLRRLPVGNRTDHVSPYIIFGPPHQRLCKNLFVPPKRLFQHGVIPGSSQTKAQGISSLETYEVILMWPCNNGERQWCTMSDWTCR